MKASANGLGTGIKSPYPNDFELPLVSDLTAKRTLQEQLLEASKLTNSKLDTLINLIGQLVETITSEEVNAPEEAKDNWQQEQDSDLLFKPLKIGELLCTDLLRGFEEIRLFKKEGDSATYFRLRDFYLTQADDLNIYATLSDKVTRLGTPVHIFRFTNYSNNQSKDGLVKTIFIEKQELIKVLETYKPRSKFYELAHEFIKSLYLAK